MLTLAGAKVDDAFRWTDAGAIELVLLGAAVLLTLAVATVFALVILRRDDRDGPRRGGSASDGSR